MSRLIVEPEPLPRRQRYQKRENRFRQPKQRKKPHNVFYAFDRWDKQFPPFDLQREERAEDFVRGIYELLPRELNGNSMVGGYLQRVFSFDRREPNSRVEDLEHLAQILPRLGMRIKWSSKWGMLRWVKWNRSFFELIYVLWCKKRETFYENWCFLNKILFLRNIHKVAKNPHWHSERSRTDVFYRMLVLYLMRGENPEHEYHRPNLTVDDFKFLFDELKRHSPLPFADDFIGYDHNDLNCVFDDSLTFKDIPFDVSAYQEIARRGQLGINPRIPPRALLEIPRRKICQIFSCGYWRSMPIEMVRNCLAVIDAYYDRTELRPTRHGRNFFDVIKPSFEEISLTANLCLENEMSPYILSIANTMYCTSCFTLERYMHSCP